MEYSVTSRFLKDAHTASQGVSTLVECRQQLFELRKCLGKELQRSYSGGNNDAEFCAARTCLTREHNGEQRRAGMRGEEHLLHRAETALQGGVQSLHALDSLLAPLDEQLAPFREQASALHVEHERCASALHAVDALIASLDDCNAAETELASLRKCGDAVGHAKRLQSLANALDSLSPHERSAGVGPTYKHGASVLENSLVHALSDVSRLSSSLNPSSSQLQEVLKALYLAGYGSRAAKSFGSARLQLLSSDLCSAASPPTSSALHAVSNWSVLSKERAQNEGPVDLHSLMGTFAASLDASIDRWREERNAATTAFEKCSEDCAHEAFVHAVSTTVKWVHSFCDGAASVKDVPDRAFALADAEHSLHMRQSVLRDVLNDDESLISQVVQAESVVSNSLRQRVAELEVEVRKSTKSARHDGMVHPVASRFTVFFRRFAEHQTRLMTDTEVKQLAWRVDDSLHATLESKSEAFKEKALAELFMMNNAAFLASSGRRSERLVDVMGNSWVDGKEKESFEHGERYVEEAWAKAQTACEAGMVQLPVGQKEKEQAKKACTRFNQVLEDNLSAQCRWAVPEKHMRNWLLEQVQQRVCEPYEALYVHLSKAAFSKHPERYLKLSPQQVRARLDGLFSLGSS